jgi:putative GTP pyrophosphokinase
MNVNEAVQAYQDQRPTYERFALKLRRLLEELLEDYAFGETIEYRTKEVDHFREKVTRVGKNYTDPLTEITDLCGLRIILRRRSDVQRVVSLIRGQFDIDEAHSSYKEDELNVDQFGYSSVHLVVQLKGNRVLLPEWSRFENLKAEIQVRTILQHAWAQIAHDFDYKTEADVPRELRRRLFRVSAQIETADLELEHFTKEVDELLKTYKLEVSEGNAAIELNVDSLRVYIQNAPEVRRWNDSLQDAEGFRLIDPGELSRTTRTAELCDIKSLDQLSSVMQAANAWGETFIKLHLRNLQLPSSRMRKSRRLHRDAVVGWFLIAAHIERFTPQMIENLGWANPQSILDAARKARKLD